MDFSELFEKLKSTLSEEEIENIQEDTYLLEELIGKKTDLEVYSSEGETFWIGRGWATIGDDETGKQFKESVEGDLKTLFNDEDVECDTHEEEIYS